MKAGERCTLLDGTVVVAVTHLQKHQTLGWWVPAGDDEPREDTMPDYRHAMWKYDVTDEGGFEEGRYLLMCPIDELDKPLVPEILAKPSGRGESTKGLPNDNAARARIRGLPTEDASRKSLPVFRGPLMYFPDAMLAVAAVCKAGNDQHNPGQPLHWAREKSTEQMDTALRHMMDHALGTTKDIDGTFHMAKAAWRCLAELQLTIEKSR